MPPTLGPCAQTTGSSHFDPDEFFDSWAEDANTLLPQNDSLRSSIIAAFKLAESDKYIYHAIASVTLAQVQESIDHGGENGLHAWYPDASGKPSEVGNLEAITVSDLMRYSRFSFDSSFLLLRQRTLVLTRPSPHLPLQHPSH